MEAFLAYKGGVGGGGSGSKRATSRVSWLLEKKFGKKRKQALTGRLLSLPVPLDPLGGLYCTVLLPNNANILRLVSDYIVRVVFFHTVLLIYITWPITHDWHHSLLV
jgi:hypothetical protein